MKKILMGTSAIAMAGAAGQANAATWDLDWGGYFEASIAYSSIDTPGDNDGFDGVDVAQDAEIQFTPSITLDNGLTFGIDIQLEGNTSGDTIDESFAFVKGSFGQILIGSENSAGYKMTYAAPDVTWIGVNSGSLSQFIPGIYDNDVFRGTGGTSFVEVGQNNDAQRITYFTPRFSGFQLGASYARDGGQDGGGQINDDAPGALHDIFDVGANYVNSFGAFDVGFSARYGIGTLEAGEGTAAVAATPGLGINSVTGNTRVFTSQARQDVLLGNNPNLVAVVDAVDATPAAAGGEGGDPEVYAFGATLGYAGFTIGGSYAKSDDTGFLAQDGDFFDVGVSYTTGPWGVSFTYSHGENELSQNGPDSELDQYIAGVTYKLGPGVAVGAFAGYAELDVPGDSFNDISDVEGFFIGTGFKLNF